MSIDGVGEIVALTWVLEIGEVNRFSSIGRAQSYCGLTSAQNNSAGVEYGGPISKQRNKHLQTVLVEAAKLARGNRNRGTLAVARKMVAYLMASIRVVSRSE
jgi:transposase